MTKKRRPVLAALLFGLAVSSAVGCGDVPDRAESVGTEQSPAVPTGFVDDLISSGIPSPTTMEFAPDGRLFVAQQNGQLRVLSNANPPVLLSTPFLTVTVNS